MKALSVHEPWATAIAQGRKRFEIRSRNTHHRGPLLICSTKPTAVTRCIVTITASIRFRREHATQAMVEWKPGLWAWKIGKVLPLKPTPVKGQQGLWNYPLSPRKELDLREKLHRQP